jgi:hypothetical protein
MENRYPKHTLLEYKIDQIYFYHIMEKKKTVNKQPSIVLPEKHPLEEPPAEPDIAISEEDLDSLPDEEIEETLPYEPPPEGEGP